MKKIKLFLALMMLLPFSRAFAQVGEIIYRDFDPDSILIYWQKLGPVLIDLDGEGEFDLKMWMEAEGSMCLPYMIRQHTNIKFCVVAPDCVISEVEAEEWTHFLDWRIVTANYHYGFRIMHEGGYLYGWFETYSREVSGKNEKRTVHLGFDRTAFCTIPNYPLRWGQIDLVSVEENESNALASLRPNPTNGTVFIEGVEAAEVQVYDVLGQCVKTVPNTNEINLEGLPQGVYLLRVTLEDGKVFSDKVVKE